MAEEIVINTINIHQIVTDWRIWAALFVFYTVVGLFQRIGHNIWDLYLFKKYLKALGVSKNQYHNFQSKIRDLRERKMLGMKNDFHEDNLP